MASGDFARPLTTGAAVAEELRTMIVTGRLKPGTPLRQAPLAEQLGVSRLPVREALNTLQAEGQVVHVPHKGFVVARLDFQELQDVYRLRDLIESDAIRLALRRGVNDQIVETMTGYQDTMRRSLSLTVGEAARLNKLFHFSLFEASGSRHQVRLIRQLWDSTAAYRALYYASSEHLQTVLNEHEVIVDGVRNADVEAVVRACARHREGTLKILGKTLSP